MTLKGRERGFSMIELMVVIVIIMLIAGMATPSLVRAITTIRLRSGVGGVASLVQRCRIEAVRSNRIMVVRQDFLNDKITPVFWIDGAMKDTTSKQDGKIDQWEGLITVNRDLQLVPYTDAPAFPYNDLLGYPDSKLKDLPFNLAFNQRGLPCPANSTASVITSCNLNITETATSDASYQYFFKMKSTFGDQWGSITVTPAGRVRVWTWNGKSWS